MKRVTGRLLGALSYQVDKRIEESLYKNEAFLGNRWNFLEKNVVTWSTHYKKYTALTPALHNF